MQPPHPLPRFRLRALRQEHADEALLAPRQAAMADGGVEDQVAV
jgi:hypothetical protein